MLGSQHPRQRARGSASCEAPARRSRYLATAGPFPSWVCLHALLLPPRIDQGPAASMLPRFMARFTNPAHSHNADNATVQQCYTASRRRVRKSGSRRSRLLSRWYQWSRMLAGTSSWSPPTACTLSLAGAIRRSKPPRSPPASPARAGVLRVRSPRPSPAAGPRGSSGCATLPAIAPSAVGGARLLPRRPAPGAGLAFAFVSASSRRCRRSSSACGHRNIRGCPTAPEPEPTAAAAAAAL